MTNLSPTHRRPINHQHVSLQCCRRWSRSQTPDFLYEEIARRLTESLQYMHHHPQKIVDAGCGLGRGMRHLEVWQNKLEYFGIDHSQRLLDLAKKQHMPSGWKTWFGAKAASAHWICTDMADMPGLDNASVDTVWSNLALHWHAEPHKVIQEWARVVKEEGLVLFSTFGPSSFQEIRSAVQALGYPLSGIEWVDMHDYGDLLLQYGFENPVLDQERLTITYSDPAQLLREMHTIAGNPVQSRCAHGIARSKYLELLDVLEHSKNADGFIPVTIEVAYAHAWRQKSTIPARSEVYVPVSSILKKS